MPKQPKRWMYSPGSGAKPTIPERLKEEVTAKANELNSLACRAISE